MRGLVLACLIASSSLSALAANDDDAWTLLQKAAVAARALNYQGVFVYQSGRQTKSVQITHYFGGQSNFWAKISAMSVLGTLPIFVVTAFMQRYFVRGISLGAVKG